MRFRIKVSEQLFCAIKIAGAISAREWAATIFKYNEGVVFNHPRARSLRWQRSSRPRAHRQKRGEEQRDYSEERRAQRCERHQESRAHCSLYADQIIDVMSVGEFSNVLPFPYGYRSG